MCVLYYCLYSVRLCWHIIFLKPKKQIVLQDKKRRPSIIAALTQEIVAVTTDFSGMELTLYGFVKGLEEGDDIIILTKGPQQKVQVMQKKRIFGVWVNINPVEFNKTPLFYNTMSTRPLDLISSFSSRRRLELGLEHIKFSTPETLKFEIRYGVPVLAVGKGVSLINYRNAIIHENKRSKLYLDNPFGVEIVEGGLFRAVIPLPSTTPIGEYQILIYLMRKGQEIANRKTHFQVMKVGLERMIYQMAHKQPVLYAFLAIFIAIFAGWLANIIWTRR